MKRALLIALIINVGCLCLWPAASQAFFTFGIQRDWMCFNQCYPAPCDWPMALNPCAVPCRPPSYQPQAVPCAIDTACPSLRLPCHGVAYGKNPYPLFRP